MLKNSFSKQKCRCNSQTGHDCLYWRN